MYNNEELKRKLQEGEFNDTLKMLYGESGLYSQITRYSEAVDSLLRSSASPRGWDCFPHREEQRSAATTPTTTTARFWRAA